MAPTSAALGEGRLLVGLDVADIGADTLRENGATDGETGGNAALTDVNEIRQQGYNFAAIFLSAAGAPEHKLITPLDDTIADVIGKCRGPSDSASLFELEKALRDDVSYAAFCGVQVLLLPGLDASLNDQQVVRYGKLIRSLLALSSPHLVLSLPMWMHAKHSHVSHTWRQWNRIRSICDYSKRLTCTLKVPPHCPAEIVTDRWCAEPIRAIVLHSATFIPNQRSFPVLSKAHQKVFLQLALRKPLVILVQARGSMPFIGGMPACLKYIRYLEQLRRAPSAMEKLGEEYHDLLQTPLQPLLNNLESMTYEVFEQDPVKYEQYEKAIYKAVESRDRLATLNIAIVGAGRGPLVHRTLKALKALEREGAHVYAVEKNINAIPVLRARNAKEWAGRVHIVTGDMRVWQPEVQFDIVISELLGSFGDNELSPECIESVMPRLKTGGISIPESYESFITPIMSPLLHQELQKLGKPTAWETPYVVLLTAFNYLCAEADRFESVWSFTHTQSGRAAGPAVFTRYHCAHFVSESDGVFTGVAGYFEAKLFGDVYLSILPSTIDTKSPALTSWFPLYFPLRDPLIVSEGSEIQFQLWREHDDRKCWYEWVADVVTPGEPVKISTSMLHNSMGSSYSIIL